MKIAIISKLVINNANNAGASSFCSAEICAPSATGNRLLGPTSQVESKFGTTFLRNLHFKHRAS
jgi:hypothetical protein